MKPNLNLVRDILKQAYVVLPTEPLALVETWSLSPIGNDSRSPEDNISDHVQLMVERGLLVFSNRIKSNGPADFATIEPTHQARDWAYCAHDDKRWRDVETEIFEFLTSEQEAEDST